MILQPAHRPNVQHPRHAFTLVEMLVATGLVVLIMLLFAQVYGTAIGSITRQRGVASNDQKARQLETTLRRDLQAMTYRQPSTAHGRVSGIVPLAPGDEPILDGVNQRGFFYYSENNPENPTDDVIHLTTWATVGARGDSISKRNQTKFTGRAKTFRVRAPAPVPPPDLRSNEPDTDDGAINGQGASRAAEVVYFMRNGNLYRRQLLLRDTFETGTPKLSQPGLFDPGSMQNTPRFRPVYDPGNNIDLTNYPRILEPNPIANQRFFLHDFDYSATRVYQADPRLNTLWFNTIDSLSNDAGTSNNPIALPWNRFGFFNNPEENVATGGIPLAHHGSPREYANTDDESTFIGRLTHEETSTDSHPYPGQVSQLQTNVGPETYVNRRTQVPSSPPIVNGALNGLGGGARVGEDIVLTGVESFNVQIFDSLFGGYVDIGDQDTLQFQITSDPTTNDRLNPWYGPRNPLTNFAGNRVFDTWHPDVIIASPSDPTNGAPFDPVSNPGGFSSAPPFRPLRVSPANIIDWDDLINNAASGNSPRANLNAQIRVPALNGNNSMFYRAVNVADLDGDSVVGEITNTLPDLIDENRPEFPPVPGHLVQDNEVTWQCIDNRIGIRGIRIVVRYRDQRSQLPRQLTIVHSFVE